MMVEPFIVLGLFAALYLVLHLLFHVCVEAVCLVAVAFSWLLLIPFEPLRWTCSIVTLLAGAFFGFRVIPAQTLAGLGFPPWFAGDHAEFHRIARQIGGGIPGLDPGSSFMEMNTDRSMHLGALRIYNHSVLWTILATCGHLFYFKATASFFVCLPIALTSFPLGFVFKRWLARHSGEPA